MAPLQRRLEHGLRQTMSALLGGSVEVPPQQLDLTPGELRADQGASITDHWNHSGAAEPRFELAERQQDRE